MTEEYYNDDEVGVCDCCGEEVAWMGPNVRCEGTVFDEDGEEIPCPGQYELKEEN